ncbi:serine/threonine-protein kinase haspin [Suncus etruscus]|uniref:serine/threonine-protein kinase haspin n=1 Tax=Suncus etruscus TaxID=109475 RepID=UPI002110330F|nr:serine/threonine-protein kinase haspin [Suncus etruscus]
MAAPLGPPGCRLFRTYGGVAGGGPRRGPARAAAAWFQPQSRKYFSSSGSDTSGGAASPSVTPDDPKDPDFACSRVTPPRRRIAKEPPGLAVTPTHLRLRARPPRKCSTPCGPPGPPPLPSCSPVRGHPRDSSELGTSASLFSPPASPAPTGNTRTRAGPSASVIDISDLSSEPSVPAATLDPAEPPSSPLASRWDSQPSGNLGSALFDPKMGAKRKTRRKSSKRLKNPGVSRICKKRTKGPGGFRGAALLGDCEETDGLGSCTVSVEINRPQKAGSCRKRKRRETLETSLPLHGQQHQQDHDTENEPCPGQDLTHLQNACSWTQTRASFGLHKKKVVTAVSNGSTIDNALCSSLLSEYYESPVANQRKGARAPWRSSSMYLLTPIQMTNIADKKASDAKKVYGECNQEGPVPFSCFLPPEKLECCQKIGEGVFGEVFQLTFNHMPVALKIIAIEGQCLVNGAHQKTFEEILPEIIISKELSLLSDELINRTEGFIGLNSVHCVQGSYPPLFLRAWDEYNSAKESANDRPDFFDKDQLFIVLEFEFGGTDLERMKTELTSLTTAKSILHQVTASLAVAESSLHFEHRDLHWGNVLLKKTHLKELHYTLDGKTKSIPTLGLQVNIIDYTLSRLERDGIVIFCDISKDEDLFTGEGDYQFEIYRLMRKENNNCWDEYHPYNNVLWLHYLTDKILKEMTYKRKCSNPSMKQMKRKIQHFHRTMLNFSSATELLCQHCLFK